jgi:hypothetical protein
MKMEVARSSSIEVCYFTVTRTSDLKQEYWIPISLHSFLHLLLNLYTQLDFLLLSSASFLLSFHAIPSSSPNDPLLFIYNVSFSTSFSPPLYAARGKLETAAVGRRLGTYVRAERVNRRSCVAVWRDPWSCIQGHKEVQSNVHRMGRGLWVAIAQ